MPKESDPLGEGGTVDERIRRLAADPRSDDIPTEIRDRVLARVRRRRRVIRTGYAGITIVALVVVGLSVSRLSQNGPQGAQLAKETVGSEQPSNDSVAPRQMAPSEFKSDQSAEMRPLDAPLRSDVESLRFLAAPPVVSLDLIGADEYALLDCLEALKEELQ